MGVTAIKTFLYEGKVLSGNRKSAVEIDPVCELVDVEVACSLRIDILEDSFAVQLVLFFVVFQVVFSA